ncbi:TPA: FIVAR domain-containing protein, partial [Clostridium perfringens]|nr:FIVAR domain-containing protein [Clostridium perfringens]HBC2035103.1 FIVAR domain-containing protein [Clostridium perfringens]HBC2058241.1 FIVAR domain-containing protein [Clostridium perfringens]HBC2072457.1 FIVAR domain-containing protein [Clostridium perfringens]
MNRKKIISMALLATVISGQISTSVLANPLDSNNESGITQNIEESDAKNTRANLGNLTNVYVDASKTQQLKTPNEYIYPEEVTLYFEGEGKLDGKVIASGTKVTEPGLHKIEITNGGTNTYIFSVIDNINGKEIVSVGAGWTNTGIVDNEGNLYIWGMNDQGQLGTGSTTDSYRPVKVNGKGAIPTNAKITSFSNGNNSSSAIDNNGNLYTWGNNLTGQLGDGSTTDRHTPVKINGKGAIPTNAKIISNNSGQDLSSAIDNNGNLYTWGNNRYGQLGDGSTTQRNIPVKINGKGAISASAKIISSSLGMSHASAVDSNGNLYTWGANHTGQLGDGSTTQRNTPVKINGKGDIPANAKIIQAVMSGQSSTGGKEIASSSAIDSNGNLYTWGDNRYGQLGDGSTTERHTPVRINGKGDIPANAKIVAIDSGDESFIALDSKGNIYTWGNNSIGQLGDGSTTDRHTPVKINGKGAIPANAKIVSINSGRDHVTVLDSEGNLYTWGANYSNQGGYDLKEIIKSPIEVPITVDYEVTDLTEDSDYAYINIKIKNAIYNKLQVAYSTDGGKSYSYTSPVRDDGMAKITIPKRLNGEPNINLKKEYQLRLAMNNKLYENVNNSTNTSAIEKVDKTELEGLLKENISTEGMTQESANAYKEAIAAGQKVFDNPDATQDQVNEAIKAIKDAKTNLTVDKSGLQGAIDTAKDKLQNGNLNQESHDRLQDAINKAEGVLNKPDATVDEVKNAIKDLQGVLDTVVQKANKEKLQELINNKVSVEGMTPESAKAYNDAIAAGQIVLDNPNATQEQVDAAVKAIEDAKAALTPAEATIESNFKEAYWDGNHLTFGGTFDITGTDADQNVQKVLKIKNEQGDVVKTISTWNASWNGNTGYQCFINAEDFESLSNGKYKLFVSATVDNVEHERTIKQPNSLLKFLVHDNINKLETFRTSNATIDFSSDAENNIVFDKVEASALVTNVNAKTMYFLNNDLVIDGNFGFEGIELNAPLNTKLVLKDSMGETIETIAAYNANWGEKNTGFQCIIREDVLTKLATGEYTLYATAEYQGKAYEAKLTSKSNININKVIAGSNISANGNVDSVTITKSEKVKYQSSANIKQSYWDGDDFVINGNINIGDKELDKSITKKLIIKNSQGEEVNSINTASVDWFTKNGDYSGFQAVIPKAIIEQLKVGEYSFE